MVIFEFKSIWFCQMVPIVDLSIRWMIAIATSLGTIVDFKVLVSTDFCAFAPFKVLLKKWFTKTILALINLDLKCLVSAILDERFSITLLVLAICALHLGNLILCWLRHFLNPFGAISIRVSFDMHTLITFALDSCSHQGCHNQVFHIFII